MQNINGYDVRVKTKVDGSNRLSAKVVVPDLDNMVIARVSGPVVVNGKASEVERESVVKRAVKRARKEFGFMAAMALGEDVA